MARIKYYYNKETCNYESVKTSRRAILWSVLGFLSVSFVFAIGIFWGYSNYFGSPQEARLRQENALLQHHYRQLRQEIDKSHQILACLQEQDDSLYRMILEIEPIPHARRNLNSANIVRCQDLADKHALIATTEQKINQLTRQLSLQIQSYDEIRSAVKGKEKRLAAIPAIQPLSNKDLKRLSSPFGMRLHPIHKIPVMHEGVDFAAPRGTPIYATGNGVVKLAKKSARGYGNHVEIDHGYGFLTKYCHMQSFKVKPGQKVTRGQCIGYVGSTGTSTSPHLHYEIVKNRKKVNPVHYFVNDLDAQQYDMLLELASRKIRTPS
ncbi:MAG: M23 family metallopeptidase [Bacteroidota bacterium]